MSLSPRTTLSPPRNYRQALTLDRYSSLVSSLVECRPIESVPGKQ